MNKDKILRGQPFRNIIGKIIDVKPTPHGHSSTTFIIVGSSGKRYKLRYFRGLRKAIQIEKNVRKLPHVFPEFYGREERFLLFEWIDGDIVGKRMPPDDAYQIGKIVGEAHELEEIDHVNYFRNYFRAGTGGAHTCKNIACTHYGRCSGKSGGPASLGRSD